MDNLLAEPNHLSSSDYHLSERLLDHDDTTNNNNYKYRPEVNQQHFTNNNTHVISIPDDGRLSLLPSGQQAGGGGEQHQQQQSSSVLAPDRIRDFLFLILFAMDVVAIMYLAFTQGWSSVNYTPQPSSNSNSYAPPSTALHMGGIFTIFLGGVILSLLSSALLVSLLTRFAQHWIELSLGLALISSIVAVVILLLQHYWIGVILGVILGLYTTWWARTIWHRIPFASSTLQTALAALQCNGGVWLVAYGTVFLTCLYTVIWILACIGVLIQDTCSDTSTSCDPSSSWKINPFMALFLLVSYYWTCSVLKNCLHVTVSGVVGTWWFAPDLSGTFWNAAIKDSYIRSTTTSLGSVCLGSLLVAIIQTLYQLLFAVRRSHPMRRASLLLCVVECLVSCLGQLVSYVNKYAFVYIGLYGYDFVESGHKTFELFQHRGWTTVVQDDLIGRALKLASFVVGLVTATLGVLLVQLHPSWMSDYGTQHALMSSFVLCLLVGIAISDTVAGGVVSSACDTVMVCFAEAPRELEQNHPGLHRSLIQAWEQVYPTPDLQQQQQHQQEPDDSVMGA